MGDYGFGGDLNGNGKFDPGDYEIWKDTMKDSSGGGGRGSGGGNGGGSGAGWIIFIIVCAVLEGFARGLGVIVLVLGAYFYWVSH